MAVCFLIAFQTVSVPMTKRLLISGKGRDFSCTYCSHDWCQDLLELKSLDVEQVREKDDRFQQKKLDRFFKLAPSRLLQEMDVEVHL